MQECAAAEQVGHDAPFSRALDHNRLHPSWHARPTGFRARTSARPHARTNSENVRACRHSGREEACGRATSRWQVAIPTAHPPHGAGCVVCGVCVCVCVRCVMCVCVHSSQTYQQACITCPRARMHACLHSAIWPNIHHSLSLAHPISLPPSLPPCLCPPPSLSRSLAPVAHSLRRCPWKIQRTCMLWTLAMKSQVH